MKTRIFDRGLGSFVTVRLTDRHDKPGHPSYLCLSCEGQIVSAWLTSEEAGEAVNAVKAKDIEALGQLIDGAYLRSIAA